MNKLFIWLVRIFIALCILAAIILLLAWYFLSRSLPDYDASYTLDGLNGKVEILRDRHAVPHIFADQHNDVYFGLGFVHAQERLWQILMKRRAAQGRLSEVLGAGAISFDLRAVRFDIYTLAQKSLQHQTNEGKAALTAYSAGINAWINIIQRDARGRGAPEMFLLPLQIAPWQPVDTLALMRHSAIDLIGEAQAEVIRAITALTLKNPKRWKDLYPGASEDETQPDLAWLADKLGDTPADMLANTQTNDTPLHAPLHAATLPPPYNAPYNAQAQNAANGSNIWAIAPHRARDGKPLLANDPHLPFTAPSEWMLAALHFPNHPIIGATQPGIPLIISGRSDKLAWGVTVSYVDDADMYFEQLNPDNPNEYLTPRGYTPFRMREASIPIKDSAPLSVTLRWSENGPIVSGHEIHALDAITPKGHVMSLNSNALAPQDRSLSGGIAIMHAGSVDEAMAAGAMSAVPSLNIAMADHNDIAHQLIGRVPKRDKRHSSKGRVPSKGWLVQNRWQGFFDYSNNVSVKNPQNGLVANTNNQITSQPFPNHLANDWVGTQRIRRLLDLMNGREIHTRSSFVETQLDSVSEAARGLLPLIARSLWFSQEVAEPGTVAAYRQRAIDLLADWNGEMSPHQPEPLIFAAWMRHLQMRLVDDELGEVAGYFYKPRPVFMERVFRDKDGAAAWCDVTNSDAVETCDDMARHSLDEAILELRGALGDDLEAWRWGQVHQALQDHRVLGRSSPLLGWFLNIRQEIAGGDFTLQNASLAGGGAQPYASVHGAGYRMVVDFADLESSLYIISTGQSGHFLSAHYDDLSQLWRRGEYIPMVLEEGLVRANPLGVTRLSPVINGE